MAQNDLALVMATALDLTDEGKLMLTVQIPIPSPQVGSSGGGGSQEQYFLLSAEGTNIHNAKEKLERRLSRRLFYDHRSILVIGESLARRGIKDLLDHFSRDPNSRIRAYVLIAKGKQGREILKIKYPFERIPAEAFREMEHAEMLSAVTLRDFLVATSTEGTVPIVGTVEPVVASKNMIDKKDELIQLAGAGIMKEFKLVGYLNADQSENWLWVTGNIKRGIVDAQLPYKLGNVSLKLMKVDKRKIKTEVRGDKVHITVELKGEGILVENNSPLNLNSAGNLQIVEKALSAILEKHVHQTITQVQRKYKTDIFGFGQAIYRNDPQKWKTVKKQWEAIFPKADVTIHARLTVSRTGMSGAPVHLKDEDVKME